MILIDVSIRRSLILNVTSNHQKDPFCKKGSFSLLTTMEIPSPTIFFLNLNQNHLAHKVLPEYPQYHREYSLFS